LTRHTCRYRILSNHKLQFNYCSLQRNMKDVLELESHTWISTENSYLIAYPYILAQFREMAEDLGEENGEPQKVS
jgi:hypothetical protein